MKTKLSILITLWLAAALLAVVAWLPGANPPAVNADAITNYEGRFTIDAGTPHTADWNTTAWSVQGYGSVYIQVTQDITTAGDSVVYTLYRSIDPVACSAVTRWAVAFDRVLVANPAVAAGRYVTYTRQTTTTVPYNIVYNYTTIPAVAASVSTLLVTQTASLMGDVTRGIEVDTGGAWCMRLAADATTGRTVTATIYVAPTDIYH